MISQWEPGMANEMLASTYEEGATVSSLLLHPCTPLRVGKRWERSNTSDLPLVAG